METKTPEEILAMNSEEYKRYHESVMQNNNGSTAFYTFMCIFFTIQCSLFCCITPHRTKYVQYVLEYSIIILSCILALTFLSEFIYLLNFIMSIILMFKIDCWWPLGFKAAAPNYLKDRFQCVSLMRAVTYLMTVFCILAVDFNVFSRHLAKTEKYGYSLMDCGVGLFVLMSGLVHKHVTKDNYISVLKGNINFCIILITLGIVRFVSILQLDYQKHDTEYGVFWNFFFTLVVCKLFSTLILIVYNHPILWSILLIILHQCALNQYLEGWVISNIPRDTFLNANREGITACPGYVSLYLFAVHIKNILQNNSITRGYVLKNISFTALFLWGACYITGFYSPPSRMLANFGYCVYVEAIFTTITTVTYFAEVIFEENDNRTHFKMPLLLSAMNSNGLVYFLVANMLTGAINMNIRTLCQSGTATFFILNAYMIATTVLCLNLNIYS